MEADVNRLFFSFPAPLSSFFALIPPEFSPYQPIIYLKYITLPTGQVQHHLSDDQEAALHRAEQVRERGRGQLDDARNHSRRSSLPAIGQGIN